MGILLSSDLYFHRNSQTGHMISKSKAIILRSIIGGRLLSALAISNRATRNRTAANSIRNFTGFLLNLRTAKTSVIANVIHAAETSTI